ncbi:MAG: hypothetical protein R3B93_07995 [Bacteroidia bacterium]
MHDNLVTVSFFVLYGNGVFGIIQLNDIAFGSSYDNDFFFIIKNQP